MRLLTVCLTCLSLVMMALTSRAQSQALVNCFEERAFRYTAGKYNDAEIKYRLHVPENVHYGQKYPLIVHLHGIGEAGADNTFSLLYLDSVLPLMTGSKQEHFFLLVMQCPKETPGWSFRPKTKDGTLDVLMAAIEHALAENPIDLKRITATGVSSGGWGTWQLLMEHPDMFAGAVPTACGAPSQPHKLAALKHTPVWSIVNKGDISPETLQMAMGTINRAGGSMAYTETSASGHNAWTPAMADYHCFQWMLAQKRGSWFAPPPGTVVQQPYSLLFVFAMFILPLAIIGFMTWGTMCEWTATAVQSLKEWFASDR